MKLSEKLKERLKLLIVNRLAVESSSPASYLSGYRQAIRDVEMAETDTLGHGVCSVRVWHGADSAFTGMGGGGEIKDEETDT
jgi:hypothetical protein